MSQKVDRPDIPSMVTTYPNLKAIGVILWEILYTQGAKCNTSIR